MRVRTRPLVFAFVLSLELLTSTVRADNIPFAVAPLEGNSSVIVLSQTDTTQHIESQFHELGFEIKRFGQKNTQPARR